MLTINHQWTCDICGHAEQSQANYKSHAAIVDCQSLPPGWSHIRNKLVCSAHRIVATRENDVPWIWESNKTI